MFLLVFLVLGTTFWAYGVYQGNRSQMIEDELTNETVDQYIACLGGCQNMQILYNITKNETLQRPINPIYFEICRELCWNEFLVGLPYTTRYI